MKSRNTKSPFSPASVLSAALAVILAVTLFGCGGSKETTTDNGVEHEPLAAAEARFNPSDYNRDPAKVADADAHGPSHAVVETVVPKPILDTVQGFRVQVLFTQDIEQAGQLRDSLNSMLPGQYVYVVYDAPYYKVRVGNFAERPDANELLRSLVRRGYSDAWVVRDNVILNLPPRPQAVTSEPDTTSPPDSTANH